MTSNFLKNKIDEMYKRIGKCKKETSDGVILGDPSAKTAAKFKILGDFINTKSDIKSTQKEENLGKLHAEAKVPHPLMLDEVSASFISWLRVSSWEDLGKEFGGYKVGRILAYILDVLNQQIEDSTAATIRVDVPLYEQCPTVSCKCGGKCKHEKSDEVDNLKQEIFYKNYYLSEIKSIAQEPIDEHNNPKELINRINTRLNSLYMIAEKGYKYGENKSEADEVKNEMTLIKMENEVLHCRACLREIRKTIYNAYLSPCSRNIQDEVRDILQNISKKVKEGLKEEEI